jgi:hypothetical protein
VYSLDEVRAAIARDPVVAAHYGAVNLDEMQLVTLTEGKAAYVSYRIGGRVYWTRERVYLKAGETVLTDGHTTIRARCGNCVSDVKQEAVGAVEPAKGELDDFVLPSTPETGVDAFGAEQGLGNLLEVPFGPQIFASAAPMWQPPVDDAFGESGFPTFRPPFILPGGGGTGGTPPPPFVPSGGGPGGGGGGGTTAGTTGGSGGDTTGGTSTASPTGSPTGSLTGSATGSATGSPTDTLTTGLPVDTTSAASTGTATGDLATGSPTGDLTGTGGTGGTSTTATGGTSTTGVVTDGTVFPTSTTAGGSTSSSGVTSAPEPEVMWLVTTALIGLASRRLRSK